MLIKRRSCTFKTAKVAKIDITTWLDMKTKEEICFTIHRINNFKLKF